MGQARIDEALVERLYREAKAERWRLPVDVFAQALETSCKKAFSSAPPSSRELHRYLSSLRLEDLALACACALGDERAWDHFVLEQRPLLYRAADAIDPAGGARDLADSLYGDLYGLDDRSGKRQSLFRYFHGRSSLTTWLRAVLTQRHVDRLRAERRIDPLPEELPIRVNSSEATDPDCARYRPLARSALEIALARLDARDRLRLACYYAQNLTLAQTGRVLHEHEATVSRNIARTRRAIRDDVERQLRDQAGLSKPQIARCFECVVEDSGTMDLAEMIGTQEI
jgi:RNA polymerase sigma-70 factor, ECF subfamily